MTIPLIVVGYVLAHNGQWFNGAHTIGVWAFWLGIAGLAIQLAIFALVAVGIFKR